MLDYKARTMGALVGSKVFPAKMQALTDALAFVEQILETNDCLMKTQMAICVAIEEMFVNVTNYAYGEEQGEVSLEVYFDKRLREITFRMADSGVAFNPLEREDPDVTLSAEERKIGGLGIYITKKTMDKMSYAYENGKNILTMTKKI